MQKLLTFFQQNISVHAIFNDRSFNAMLTNDVVSFEQLGPEFILLNWLKRLSYEICLSKDLH